jgi:putative transposase
VLRTYERRTLAADALIASCYLAGTNTRRVNGSRPSCSLARSVSRVWRKMKGCLECPLAGGEPSVLLILYGTMVRIRLDRKATATAAGVERRTQRA